MTQKQSKGSNFISSLSPPKLSPSSSSLQWRKLRNQIPSRRKLFMLATILAARSPLIVRVFWIDISAYTPEPSHIYVRCVPALLPEATRSASTNEHMLANPHLFACANIVVIRDYRYVWFSLQQTGKKEKKKTTYVILIELVLIFSRVLDWSKVHKVCCCLISFW